MVPKTTDMEGHVLPPINWPSYNLVSPGPSPSPVRSRILIVDSHASHRRSLRSALSGLDYDLVEAASTSEALSALSLGPVDLILIDYHAPKIGGIEFCRMLRKAAATQLVPIFVLCCDGSLENEVTAIDAGANEFLIRPIQPRAIRARVQANLRRKSVVDLLDDSEAVLFSLAQSVEGRDPELGQHCERLALMCAAMGVSLGLPPQDILALQRGGYLHDIGKVAVPDSILFKPGKLTVEEWNVMQSHTERGEKICSGMKSMAAVLPIIRHHHERWDGSGYPDKLSGEQIPLLARILQIADIYDALTTVRSYKPALSPEAAIRILREEAAQGWRDPRLVELFSDILPNFRTSSAADPSHYSSLRALASALDNLRKGPARPLAGEIQSPVPMKLVSGL